MFRFKRAPEPTEPVADTQPLSDNAPGVDAAPETPRAGRSRWWWISRGVAGVLFAFLLLIAWLAFTAPLSKSLQPVSPPQITLLAADGTPIARNGAIVAAPVKAADLPDHVKQAFIATEDRRFYEHWGIDPYGIARAAWTNLTTGTTQGGSTITQQLAKFTFLSPEQSLTRKARESLIAFWLEAWLSKDEILERYLSNAYYGDNTYGLRAASMHYFHRRPERLLPGQAAMLAGLMKAPSSLAPTNHYEAAEKRMRVVLAAMVDAGYMTREEAAAIPPPPLDVRDGNDLPTGTYFADWALPQARSMTEQGYAAQTLTTTLDARLQLAARRAIDSAALGSAQVALVAMRRNGEVVAMIGGKDYAKSPFNRATQAKRQPGSTFKLFVYLAALQDGWSPEDTISNAAIETGGYRPKNSGGHYSPTITLEDAFARSSNVAAVRLFQQVGDEKVIKTARRLGITEPLPEGDPSLALGTATMPLIELTAAYAGVAANSFPVEPRAFPVEEKGWFARLLDGKHSLSKSQHAAMEKMLRAAVNRGTGRAAMLRSANFGKTGTSQENRDALFVGYAGDYVVGVWVGNDDNSPLGRVSGGSTPARIWRSFMQQALGERAAPAAPKPRPEGPVQPLDIEGLDQIPDGGLPLGEGNRLRIEDGTAIITTDLNGLPLDIQLDSEGLRFQGERTLEEARRRIEREAEAPPPAGP
ncbi:transglycosylase domain-containing protein [Novosphingobium decolorationis]|uniref:peptidoglycan glycosyltransferase n=1 Tax=Novosphingobium decolorationis TaxID=2698673 RepID=A0ABX8E4Q3_9SPHN|nr:transglycosylase domain-containing protein [Novosphingobium decolorationis]MED5546225.1 transglycosylase domain-containing protein [Pseudomonadota bacterium]QVM84167.1 transglycosylase domain-containing protein [Novosphingobium decolorationis]